MLIDFNKLAAREMLGMNNGMGYMSAKMYLAPEYRIVPCTIYPGGSIGLHTQEGSDDINYIISGNGVAITDGVEEVLTPGCCHICEAGHQHSIINTGEEDLVIFTIVVQKEVK